MPLPLFLIGAAVAAGVGIGMGVKSKKDFDKADDINDDAQTIYDEATDNLERCRKNVQRNLERLDETKLALIEGLLTSFVETFSQIKNIDYADLPVPQEFLPLVEQELPEIRKITFEMADAVRVGVGALGASALTGVLAAPVASGGRLGADIARSDGEGKCPFESGQGAGCRRSDANC